MLATRPARLVSSEAIDIFVAAARSAAVRISPPLAGREDILKRLAPTPFRGCGVRPPALATRPACRVPASVGTTEAVDKRVISSRLRRYRLRRNAGGGNDEGGRLASDALSILVIIRAPAASRGRESGGARTYLYTIRPRATARGGTRRPRLVEADSYISLY